MGFFKYKGYSGSVEFSPEDNCLFGKVQGLHKATILYEGNSVDELRKDFEEALTIIFRSVRNGAYSRKNHIVENLS